MSGGCSSIRCEYGNGRRRGALDVCCIDRVVEMAENDTASFLSACFAMGGGLVHPTILKPLTAARAIGAREQWDGGAEFRARNPIGYRSDAVCR